MTKRTFRRKWLGWIPWRVSMTLSGLYSCPQGERAIWWEWLGKRLRFRLENRTLSPDPRDHTCRTYEYMKGMALPKGTASDPLPRLIP